MDCSGLLRHQETMGSQPLDSMLMCTKPESSIQQSQQEKKPRPADEQAMKCPRCDSTNTKFCYYNNYSLTQPRYFCKSCRRYWTKGGTLRNVPVGGGCRRNKRSSSISKRGTPDCHLQVHDHLITTSSPLCSYDHQTLALAHGNSHFDLFGSPSGSSFIDTLRSGLPENTSHHFLYYGHGRSANHLGDNVENGRDVNNGVDGSLEIKHEVGEDRILWGLPWQLNGERNYMMNGGNNEIDSLKGSWNSAVVGPTPTYWNNLINSPLM